MYMYMYAADVLDNIVQTNTRVFSGMCMYSRLPSDVGAVQPQVLTVGLLDLVKHERVVADLPQLDDRVHQCPSASLALGQS